MENKPAIAIIQARMSSSRLPGKVLKPLAGKPMIWHIVNRAQQCNNLDRVIVATSIDQSDDALYNYCKYNNIAVHRGSLDNVLQRFLDILKKYEYPYFVRITGDCPLIDPSIIDLQLDALYEYDGDIAWCSNPGSILEGAGAQSSRSLFYISENTDDLDDLEHVGSLFLANNPEKFKIVEYFPPEELIVNSIRLTVDKEEDYKLLLEVYNNLWISKPIDLKDVLSWLKENPQVLKINKDVRHKKLNVEIQKQRKNWIIKRKMALFNKTFFEYHT